MGESDRLLVVWNSGERSLFEVFWWGAITFVCLEWWRAKLCERASAIAVGWERAIALCVIINLNLYSLEQNNEYDHF